MPELTELQHQCKFFKWANENCVLARRYMFAIPNGGHRGKKEAAILKHQGVKRGVSDIFFAYPLGGYHGLFIELKQNIKSNRSPEQSHWLEEMTYLRYQASYAYGWEQARDILLEYLGKKI